MDKVTLQDQDGNTVLPTNGGAPDIDHMAAALGRAWGGVAILRSNQGWTCSFPPPWGGHHDPYRTLREAVRAAYGDLGDEYKYGAPGMLDPFPVAF